MKEWKIKLEEKGQKNLHLNVGGILIICGGFKKAKERKRRKTSNEK
jgi:hypothetical protein